MLIIGLILLLAGGYFWLKKQGFHLKYLQRTKGILNNYTTFNMTWLLGVDEFKNNYWDIVSMAIPFCFPSNLADNEPDQKLRDRIKKYGAISSILFGLGYMFFILKMIYPD